jgi:hypothetical protein
MDLSDSLRILAAGNDATSGNELAPPEGSAKDSKPTSESYPPAFDRETMRWMPLVIPLLGFFTAVLTGLMWTLA